MYLLLVYGFNNDIRFNANLYKNNKLFESLNKKITNTLAKQIFTKGEVQFDDLVSQKTGNTYSATLVADFSERFVKFKFTFPKSKDDNGNAN